MKNFARIVVFALLATCARAEARAPAADALIRMIAEAAAWSEMCANYAVDPVALAYFRDAHAIPVNGHYIKVYGFAFARQHVAARDSHRFHAACDRALDLYGPSGTRAPGLVRPLWHGTVPDQKINLDRW
jgi:hypothetical protein